MKERSLTAEENKLIYKLNLPKKAEAIIRERMARNDARPVSKILFMTFITNYILPPLAVACLAYANSGELAFGIIGRLLLVLMIILVGIQTIVGLMNHTFGFGEDTISLLSIRKSKIPLLAEIAILLLAPLAMAASGQGTAFAILSLILTTRVPVAIVARKEGQLYVRKLAES